MSSPLAMVPSLPPFAFAGELAALGAALTWSISISMYSHFGGGMRAHTLNLYKNIVALVALLAFVAFAKPQAPSDPTCLLWLALSGVIGLSIGDSAFFSSLKRLGAQMTAAMQCLCPPLTALIALLVLGEQLTRPEFIGMTMTLLSVGAVIIFNKRSGGILDVLKGRELYIGLSCALLAALCQASSFVISRFALQQTDALLGTTMRLLPAVIVLYLSAMLRGEFKPLAALRQEKPANLFFLGVAAFLGSCLGLLLLGISTIYTKAGIAAAIAGTYPVWIIPIAGLFLGERVTPKSAVFTLLAVCGIGLMLVAS